LKSIDIQAGRGPRIATALAVSAVVALTSLPASAQFDTRTIFDRGREPQLHERQFDYGERLQSPGFWERRERFSQLAQDRYNLGYERGRFDERAFREQFERGYARGRADERRLQEQLELGFEAPESGDRAFRDEFNRQREAFDLRRFDPGFARDLFPPEGFGFEAPPPPSRRFAERRGQFRYQGPPIDTRNTQLHDDAFRRFGFGGSRRPPIGGR